MPRLWLASVLLATSAAALDVPAGRMPRIDGTVGEEEWRDAVSLRAGPGRARLLTAGHVLCISLEMSRPYAGERIDLHVADRKRRSYTWHAFHPGCTLPPDTLIPIAPVTVRRASYSLRAEARIDPPASCLFRARVYRDAESWSAEIAVALESLDVSPLSEIVFKLNVLHPTEGESESVVFAPARGAGLNGWERLLARWQETEPFLTVEEDDRRAFEFALFRETVAQVARSSGEKWPVAEALDRRKDNAAIDNLVARIDGCLSADPLDLFAHATKVKVLLRANRIAAAAAASDAMWSTPLARGNRLVAGPRRAVLFAQFRFREGIALDLPGRDAPGMSELAAAWDAEQAARRRDPEAGDLPRVTFDTSRGKVVVELFARDAPGEVAHLQRLVGEGAFSDTAFDWITGGFGARFRGNSDRAIVLEENPRRAWRGSLAFAPREGSAGATLYFMTGNGEGRAVGRVVEGMETVDALEWKDRIVSAAKGKR